MSLRRSLLLISAFSLASWLLPSVALACCFHTVESTPLNPEFSAFFYDAYDGGIDILHFFMAVVLGICAVVFSRKRKHILGSVMQTPEADYDDQQWKTLWGAFLLRHGACLSAVTFYTLAWRTTDVCRTTSPPDFGDAVGAMLFFAAIHVCSLVANAIRYKRIPCVGWLPIGYGGWGIVMALVWMVCYGLREETQRVIYDHVTF